MVNNGKPKRIITIERQFGSGGSVIGRLAAERLGIGFYHREIPEITAIHCGIPADVLIRAEGNAKTSILYSLLMAASPERSNSDDIPLSDKVFALESCVIRELAKTEERFVLVGRCGNFIFEKSECLSVYIYATQEARLKRAVNSYGIAPDDAETLLKETDKRREDFFNSNTGRNWRHKEQYDLCLNSAELGDGLCAELITHALRLPPMPSG